MEPSSTLAGGFQVFFLTERTPIKRGQRGKEGPGDMYVELLVETPKVAIDDVVEALEVLEQHAQYPKREQFDKSVPSARRYGGRHDKL